MVGVAFVSAIAWWIVVATMAVTTTPILVKACSYKQGEKDCGGFSSFSLLSSEEVEVYRCDESNSWMSPKIKGSKEDFRHQGMRIRLCFSVTPKGSDEGLFILKIDDFVFRKMRKREDIRTLGNDSTEIPSVIRQEPIDHGIETNAHVTYLECEVGSTSCFFETSLSGYFFLSPGTIHGTGTVLMQRGRDMDRGQGAKGSIRHRRDLQHIDTFEKVDLELKFVIDDEGTILADVDLWLLILIIILILLCCCLTISCLCGTNYLYDRQSKKKLRKELGYDSDEDDEDYYDYDDEYDSDIEKGTAPVSMIQWSMKKKKKKNEPSSYDEDDVSETHSLDDDNYWIEEGQRDEHDNTEDIIAKISSERKDCTKTPSNVGSPKSPKKSPKSSKKKMMKEIDHQDASSLAYFVEENTKDNDLPPPPSPKKSPKKSAAMKKIDEEVTDGEKGYTTPSSSSPKKSSKKSSTKNSVSEDNLVEAYPETPKQRKKKKTASSLSAPPRTPKKSPKKLSVTGDNFEEAYPETPKQQKENKMAEVASTSSSKSPRTPKKSPKKSPKKKKKDGDNSPVSLSSSSKQQKSPKTPSSSPKKKKKVSPTKSSDVSGKTDEIHNYDGKSSSPSSPSFSSSSKKKKKSPKKSKVDNEKSSMIESLPLPSPPFQ